MNLKFTQEWLEKRLATADDTLAGAGGSDINELKREVQLRSVTPSIFTESQTSLGKVVRYIREQRGWSQQELADIATIEEIEVRKIETESTYEPAPRAVIYLADALGLSRERFKELVGFVMNKTTSSGHPQLQFATNSKGIKSISSDEYEAVRALVEVLAEKSATKK